MNTKKQVIPNINVTPLIDILLVLLIIFMVITPLKPARFKTLVPEKSNEMAKEARMSPRTLIVGVKGREVSLFMADKLVATADVDNMQDVSNTLAAEFLHRKKEGQWKEGAESSINLSPDERIERTVFVKAPRSAKYGEVTKVIDAIKGAGAFPIGLQIELLDN